jgi:XRE family transcriptional regulator, fatty acid utilization regulator
MRGKLFVGPRIRFLRERDQQTLQVCADKLGVSPSYLSQIETNQRPVTARVLIALSKVYGVNASEFDADDENRLIADLREASADLALSAPTPSLAELKLAAATTPRLAHQFLALHSTYRRLDERLKTLDETLGMDGQTTPEVLLPYEEVRDFFHYRDNYIDELDTAAERLADDIGIGSGETIGVLLERYLHHQLGVDIVRDSAAGSIQLLRSYDPQRKRVTLASDLVAPTSQFQLAVQIAELVLGNLFSDVLLRVEFRTKTAREVARIALANYAAGALVMPYRRFAATALSLRHDVEQLQRRYGASFEQICHRLSTLQRPGARGVPFYFVRVDQAGNITKRHSTTRFQFARFGGACPLWNIHEAFGHPGRILVQIAEMPDGVRYLCVGRSIVKRSGAYLAPNRHFAVGLGCEIVHAPQLVYSEGVRLDGPATPIGVSCRICERADCQQRAFPPIDCQLHIPVNQRRILPYAL